MALTSRPEVVNSVIERLVREAPDDFMKWRCGGAGRRFQFSREGVRDAPFSVPLVSEWRIPMQKRGAWTRAYYVVVLI